MTVDDGIIPCDDIFPASFHDQIQLQLPVFLPAKWTNQVFEFRIDVKLPKCFLCHVPPAFQLFDGFEGKICDPVDLIDLTGQLVIKSQVKATQQFGKVFDKDRTIEFYRLLGCT